MKKALLLIDIQTIYFTPGSYLLTAPEAAAAQAARALEAFRRQQEPVIHIKHLFNPVGKTGQQIDQLRQIHSLVAPAADELVIEKRYPNAFLGTELQSRLEKLGIKSLVVAGMMTHMCVDTSVRACQDYGYEVTLLGDACATKDLIWEGVTVSAREVQRAYLAALHGTFAQVVNTDTFLEAGNIL